MQVVDFELVLVNCMLRLESSRATWLILSILWWLQQLQVSMLIITSLVPQFNTFRPKFFEKKYDETKGLNSIDILMPSAQYWTIYNCIYSVVYLHPNRSRAFIELTSKRFTECWTQDYTLVPKYVLWVRCTFVIHLHFEMWFPPNI